MRLQRSGVPPNMSSSDLRESGRVSATHMQSSPAMVANPGGGGMPNMMPGGMMNSAIRRGSASKDVDVTGGRSSSSRHLKK